jgi:hypothetical protein
MKPIDPQIVKKDLGFAHSVLDSQMVTIPGNLSDSLSSAKSLLRAILGGELHVCFEGEVETSPETPTE